MVAIAIRTDGALDRRYRLSYGIGGAGRSYLTNVQEYGSDATFNGAGAVTGGTALPATGFAFASDRPSIGAMSSVVVTRPAGQTYRWSPMSTAMAAETRSPSIATAAAGSRATTVRSICWSGSAAPMGRSGRRRAQQPQRTRTSAGPRRGESSDVNGDGKADLVFVYRSSTYRCCGAARIGFVDVQLALGTASGCFTFPAARRIGSEGESNEFDKVLLADLNGDGRSDLVLARSNPLNGIYGNPSA